MFRKDVQEIVDELKNLNILIIEKNNFHRREIERILNKYKFFNRSFYESSQNALDAIMTGAVFDLVIIDWDNKNDCESIDFCNKVSKLKSSMPIVFITSTSLSSYSQAFEMGATDIIKKPFNEKDFLESLWAAGKIEAFRRKHRFNDLCSLRKKVFFRLSEGLS